MGLGRRRMGSRLGWRMGSRLARGMGARLGSWLGMAARGLGLGRTALCRGARILRRRLCCSPSCPGPVGSALGIDQSLLVIGERLIHLRQT